MCYYTLWLSPKHYVSPFVGRLAWTVNWCECSTWRSFSSFLLTASKFLKLPKTISSTENPAHLIYKSYTSHLRLTKSFSTWSYFKLLGMNIVKDSFLWKIKVSVVTVQSERHPLNFNASFFSLQMPKRQIIITSRWEIQTPIPSYKSYKIWQCPQCNQEYNVELLWDHNWDLTAWRWPWLCSD